MDPKKFEDNHIYLEKTPFQPNDVSQRIWVASVAAEDTGEAIEKPEGTAETDQSEKDGDEKI